MKRLLIVAVLLCSCAESIRFAEPQPVRRSNLRQFAKSARGTYASYENETNYVIVDERSLITYTQIDSAVDASVEFDRPILHDTIALIPLGDSLQGGELSRTSAWLRLRPKGDSVYLFGFIIDTLLNLEKGDILRRYRKRHVINRFVEPGSWKVTLLQTRQDSLTLSSIGVEQNPIVWRVLGITDSSKLIHPTRRQFNKLVKAGAFVPRMKSKRTSAQVSLD